MGIKHESEISPGIDAVVERLGELEVVLGPEVRPVLERTRARLIEAVAARDGGKEATLIAAHW